MKQTTRWGWKCFFYYIAVQLWRTQHKWLHQNRFNHLFRTVFLFKRESCNVLVIQLANYQLEGVTGGKRVTIWNNEEVGQPFQNTNFITWNTFSIWINKCKWFCKRTYSDIWHLVHPRSPLRSISSVITWMHLLIPKMREKILFALLRLKIIKCL